MHVYIYVCGGFRWKIDGFTPQGTHSPSTLIAVVALSSSSAPAEPDLLGEHTLLQIPLGARSSEGQLAVFPGSHLSMQASVRDHVSLALLFMQNL